MNLPTTLPFYDSLAKQCTNRDGSPVAIFSPRTHLLPFQIKRSHIADREIRDIYLVDNNGDEFDLQKYFQKSKELLAMVNWDAAGATNPYQNGPGGLNSFDTLNGGTTDGTHSWYIASAIKSTTGAGDAGFHQLIAFPIEEDERFYLEIDLTLNSGVAPKVVLCDFNDETTTFSDEFLLVDGMNYIILKATADEATAAILFYNDSADATNFSATVTFTRTNRPTVDEFTSYDYITYNGEKLQHPASLISELASFGAGEYDSYGATPYVYDVGAGEIAGSAEAYGLPNLDDSPTEGDEYTVHIVGLTVNSGENPFVDIDNSAEGPQQIGTGTHELTFTIDANPVGAAIFRMSNTAATDWTCGKIYVYRSNLAGLLPKGLFYLKITDGTNIWYSEWFEIRDIYENLGSSFSNSGGHPYETLETDGTKIISAINTAANGYAFSDIWDSDVSNDEEITVIFFLTLNSGAVPSLTIVDSSTVAISNVVAAAEGINEITLTATKTSDARLRISNGAASNYSTSEIWMKRKYSPNFIKLQFGNSFDLHGKRSDDQAILYQNGFVQQCWLNTILSIPDQNRINVGTEKDGIFIAEKIITQYQYKIIDFIHRSLFEALIRLPQHDNITIIDEVGNEYTPNVGNIIISYEWTSFDICTITILFNDGSFVWTENADAIT